MSYPTTILNLFVSSTGLLWGDPKDCPDPTNTADESCNGGLASVASIIRNRGSSSSSNSNNDNSGSDVDPTTTTHHHHDLHIPKLDRQTKLILMHPLGLGINKRISHDYYGWGAFLAPPYFYNANVEALQTHEFSGVLGNLDLSSNSPWVPFLENVYFDESSRATFVHFYNVEPARGDGEYLVECLVAALDYVAKVNRNNGCYDTTTTTEGEGESTTFGDTSIFFDNKQHEVEERKRLSCYLPPIVFAKNIFDKRIFNELLNAGLEHDHPPLLIYGDYDDDDDTSSSPEIARNKTAYVSIPDKDKLVSHIRIDIAVSSSSSSSEPSSEAGGSSKSKDDEETGGIVVRSASLTQFNIEELDEEFKDEEYVKDLTYLRSLADTAIVNDPVVGTSGFMPCTRDGEWRKCMGGECPIGNLFTDAIRGDADFAVMNSGGIRGPGWPAGEVTVADLWAAQPFSNQRCSGVMSGVSVFRLLNHSTSVATFESTKTELGDRLLQMSGMKMSYNTLVANGTRLMSVDVWDKEANDYLPLERLKLYEFATNSWMCNHFDEFPSMFGSDLQMDGEIPGSLDYTTNIQALVAEYLTQLNGTFNTSLRGSHVNDTQAFEPMAFIQTRESCILDNYYWHSKKQSCLPCPSGENVGFSDELMSFLITPNSEPQDFGGRNVLYNRELFAVTLAPKSAPSWVVFRDSSKILMEGLTVLQPGEPIAIEFDIDESDLTEGTTRSTVSFGIVIAGDYPGCLTDMDIGFDSLVELRSEENLNQIVSIRPVGWTLMALAVGLSVFFFAWTCKHRNHRVIKASQPIFMQLICVGTFIMSLSIIPLSIDDSIASPEGCSKACMAVPWLVCSGFAITFSALFAKLWRIHKVIVAARDMHRVVVRERDALVPIAVVVTLNLLLLLCWTLLDPSIWLREMVDQDLTNSYGFCKSEGKAHVAILTLLILLNGSAIALACERAYRGRKIGDDSFTESRWVGVACLSWLQVLVIGIPIILLTSNQPVASYFTRVAMVFLICVSMLLFMFIPKTKLMSKPPDRQSQINPRPRTSVVTTPSMRMRVSYQLDPTDEANRLSMGLDDEFDSSLVTENENLKRRIDELEKSLVLEEDDTISKDLGSISELENTMEGDVALEKSSDTPTTAVNPIVNALESISEL